MNNIDNIASVALITTGRTGTDFFQSLLDSHTQVLTFNGHLIDYYLFWRDNKNIINSEKFISEDLIYKFISHYLKYLKSHYDLAEKKDKMGDGLDESISIDLSEFVKTTTYFLKEREFNSKNFLLAVHIAYATCLGQKISSKTVFLYHIHHEQMLPFFLDDFPNAKIICMTRDPRANYYSGIMHRILAYKSNNRGMLNNHKTFSYLRRIFEDANALDKYSNEYYAIRLEDLGKKCVLNKVCGWLSIKYEDTLELSTFGGIRWRGDALSPNTSQSKGFSHDMINNKWKNELGFIEKYVFNFILNSRLKHYSYKCTNISVKDYFIVPILILIPLKFEVKIFMLNLSSRYSLRNKLYFFRINILGYLKRVTLFFKYYYFQISRKYFKSNLLACYYKK
jgi:hypothetical protein